MFNLQNSKKLQFEKFEKFSILKFPNIFNVSNNENLQFVKFQKFPEYSDFEKHQILKYYNSENY